MLNLQLKLERYISNTWGFENRFDELSLYNKDIEVNETIRRKQCKEQIKYLKFKTEPASRKD
jgi:hypothetical protein